MQVTQTAQRPDRPTISPREHVVTLALGAWMVIGVFLDGWAHLNRPDTTETFFTWWHLALYLGFLSAVAWIGRHLRAHTHLPIWRRLPEGYHLAVVGVAVFAAGGIGDAVWHTALGIEVGVDALLSPPHLLLLAGGLLVVTSPARAAGVEVEQSAPPLRRLVTAAGSLALAAALLSFFFAYAWGLSDLSPSEGLAVAALDEHAPGHAAAERVVAFGIITRMLSTVVLVGPLVYLAARWVLPAGVTSIVLASSVPVVLLTAGQVGQPRLVAALLAPLLITGVVGDGWLWKVRVRRGWPLHAFLSGTTLLLWTTHFMALAWSSGLGWPAEMWGGAIGMSVLAALGTSVLGSAACDGTGGGGGQARARPVEAL
jgi:hypothetical protein